MHNFFILLPFFILGDYMKTYVEVYVSADGGKASEITQKLHEMGLEPSFGEHDFEYKWKKNVTLPEILRLVDNVQSKLRGSGAILKFATIR
jgi:hypothetical protein